jgi:hypothetical protein
MNDQLKKGATNAIEEVGSVVKFMWDQIIGEGGAGDAIIARQRAMAGLPPMGADTGAAKQLPGMADLSQHCVCGKMFGDHHFEPPHPLPAERCSGFQLAPSAGPISQGRMSSSQEAPFVSGTGDAARAREIQAQSCSTCEGTGKLGAKGHEIDCPSCKNRSPCPTCLGKGMLGAPGREIKCPPCKGVGNVK